MADSSGGQPTGPPKHLENSAEEESYSNNAYDSGSENVSVAGSASTSTASQNTDSTADASDVRQRTDSASVTFRRRTPPPTYEATKEDKDGQVSIFINDKEFKTPKPLNYRRNSLWYLPKGTEAEDWNPADRQAPVRDSWDASAIEDSKLTIASDPNANIDRTPHQLFVELDELITQQHDDEVELWEWREKARWIKFEEDVLGAADRWGRPHVASLSFQSLIHLHKALENGIICLDMEVSSATNMMEKIVDLLMETNQLGKRNREYLKNALLLRHSSTHKAKFMKSDGHGAQHSQFLLANGSSQGHINSSSVIEMEATGEIQKDHLSADHHQVLMKRIKAAQAEPDKQYNYELLKKIPPGAEVASCLVGTLKKLEKPCVAFVRLAKGEMLDHISEVPLPVRFIFICIGPPIAHMDYTEIARSLSTLMANQRFQDAAYSALDRPAILSAMTSFLDDSLVLPPGDFDSTTLLPIMHMAKQKLKDRKEKEKAEKAAKEEARKQASNTSLASEITDEDDDPLKRTGRPFGGMIKDITRRYPKYWSDIKDACSFQGVAALIFIYFAAVSPAITFGGLVGDKTDSYIGASELLLGTTICGILFSIFAGQPLLIVGFTGPLLVFEEGVYTFATSNGIDYLSWRLWIGVWICVIGIIVVACEASFLVSYVSRFTQEIFAFLISLIFIYETFYKLIVIFQTHPLCWNYEDCLEKTGREFSYLPHIGPTDIPMANESGVLTLGGLNMTSTEQPANIPFQLLVHPNTALLSMMLTLFTFALAWYFKGLRNAKILGRTIRRALGDFGVPIAILIMVLADFLIGDDVYTQKLSVPSTFSVTSPEKRGWFVNPMGQDKKLPIGHIFSAAIPALVGSILIFLETLITGMIVNKKEHKLQKGTGFHLDIFLMGVFGLINGFMGLPFVTCATVRSVAHTSALTVISKNHAPGEQPKLEKIIEQRLTNFGVHILVGASMFLGMVLQYIPIATLFGVFLYMGVASLGGIQLYQRMVLLITPNKHHPVDTGYVRYVRKWKMHLFTFVQLLCVGVLWAVKSSPAALAFPFVLILLVPFRFFVLKYIFTPEELNELDKADSSSVGALDKPGEENEPDFFEQAGMAN